MVSKYFYPQETRIIMPPVSDLWAMIDWERRGDSPRFECWISKDNRSYTYGKGRGERTYLSKGLNPYVAEIWDKTEKLLGVSFEGCFINGYKDGSDHLGWHSDDGPDIDGTRPIAVVTCGAERELWLRPSGQSEAFIHKVRLQEGSCFVMLPGCQGTHQHRIPKASYSPCGPRISFTFRGLNENNQTKPLDKGMQV